jgi:glycosyltransferase involved in cell wall biosynthesis
MTNAMKRILLLNYEFPPLGGGASPVSYELAKRLSETKEYDIDVVTMGYKDLPKYEEVNPHFRIHRVKCWRSKKEICHPWEQLTYLISAYVMCHKLLTSHKSSGHPFDICHCHFIIPTGVLALILKKQFGLPYAITSHGSDVPGFNTDRFKLLHKFTGPLLRKISREAKTIISPSNYLRNLILANISPELAEKTVVIPNGIDTEKFKPQPKKNYIFSSGRLLPRKGFQYLIQAVSDEDIGWPVHIAGDGPMMGELKRLAEKSKTRIIFHGWLDNNGKEYKDLLEQSAIFVLASESESFGMVLAEAMSAGCVVITTNISGCAEVVGDAGLLVNSRDSVDLRSKLSSMVNDQNQLVKLQKLAKERVKRLYDLGIVLGEYIKVL